MSAWGSSQRVETTRGEVLFTATEAFIWECLRAAAGRPVSAQEIVRLVWGGFASKHTVMANVGRMRRKLAHVGVRIGSDPYPPSGRGYWIEEESGE